MVHTARKCPSCGNDVPSLAVMCAQCGYTFKAPRSSSFSAGNFRFYRIILIGCRALVLIAAILTPFVYLFLAIRTGDYPILLQAPIAFFFLMGTYYIFKAVQIIIDREDQGRV